MNDRRSTRAALAFLFAPAIFWALTSPCLASSLVVETDMRLTGISYSNLDYDAKTSTDAISFYAQRLRLAVGGKFAPDIEITARLQSLGVVGSTRSALPESLDWSKRLPYPNISGIPFVENLYFGISNIFEQPASVVIGRQPIDVGSGLFNDNGAGVNALRVTVNYPENLAGEIFTAKMSEGFFADSDSDVNALNLTYSIGPDKINFLYLAEHDYSGRIYEQGGSAALTAKALKNFYKASISRADEYGDYYASYAHQGGEIGFVDGTSAALEGYAWELSGNLKAKNTKVGSVSAGLLMSMFSGDDDATSAGDKDEAFRPTYARRFDGLEPAGYGRLFGASYNETAIALPDGYSGINTIGVLFEFNPFYAWSFGVNYFLYSSSEHPLKPQKEASGFERLLGAKYSLGAEMDLYLRYVQSKYVEIGFGYYRYTPPQEVFWTMTEPLSKYVLDFTARF